MSVISYYFRLIVTYATYYLTYYHDLFVGFPYEVQTAVWMQQWSLIMMLFIVVLLARKHKQRRQVRHARSKLQKLFGDAIQLVFTTDDRMLTRDEIVKLFKITEKEANRRELLKNNVERREMCYYIYESLIHDDVASPTKHGNIHLLMEIFNLPSFLETEVSVASMRNKVIAMDMIRAFKLYISPWVINKLLNSKQVRVRRLAMYASVMSSSDSELEYFETDFFDENCCIYDEIELGYTLHRRRAAGLKLPNLAHWAHFQKNDNTKCMFVRLMRRFDQREYCEQLRSLFLESKHKKLIEEISRTWGYLHYTDGEQLLVNTMLTQPDDTKVAIMHAVTRMASGKNLELLLDGYQNTTNPHVRFEALRCMWSYGDEGRELLSKLEAEAEPSDLKFFAFFHNPITLEKIPLDKEQAYHPSVETVYTMSY